MRKCPENDNPNVLTDIFNLLYVTNATKQMKNKEKPFGASPNVLSVHDDEPKGL